jgi:hypothetical protein
MDRTTRNVLVIVSVAVVVLLVAGGLVIVLSGDDEASATEVRADPINTVTADPFAPAAEVAPTPPDVAVPPVTQTEPTVVEGGHVGLYGGTLNTQVCDKIKLVNFLGSHPGEARAWTDVLDISVSQIATYVDGLTPVLLRSDTLITNHGYSNGRATSIPAVLQAGTAVLVDNKGFPVVKCYCGNPLSPPIYYGPKWEPEYYGPVWPGFSQTNITIIQNNTTIIDTFTLVDPVTRQPFNRPAGSDGITDVVIRTPATTTPPTTAPPVTQPPVTQPPVTQPPVTQPPVTQPPGPTAEERAVDKLESAAGACYPFPAPIEQSSAPDQYRSISPPGANPFTLQATTHNADGSVLQTFTWSVDRNTLAFTPTNSLAQVASNHCPGLR